MPDMTPEDQLALARLNLAHRLRSLAQRSRKFSPSDVENMHTHLDRFAAQCRPPRKVGPPAADLTPADDQPPQQTTPEGAPHDE